MVILKSVHHLNSIVNVNYGWVTDSMNVMTENDDHRVYSIAHLYYAAANDLVDGHGEVVLVNVDVHVVDYRVDRCRE